MVLRALAILILFLSQPSSGETRPPAERTNPEREIEIAQAVQLARETHLAKEMRLAEEAKRKDGRPAGEAATAGAVRPQTPELTGFWSGRVHQPGYAPYSMNVFFQDDITALVYYPELKCGGELQRMRDQPGAVVFQETLTQGTGACETTGTVVFQPLRSNALSWKWYYPGGRLGSTARLRRLPGMGADQIRARIRRPVAGH